MTKNYVAGIEYAGINLEAIYHAEGRCTPNGSNFYYEYTLKDHLGNARVNWRANGTAVVYLEDMHYYPFGMQMEDIGTQNPANKYLYNGKERNEDLGLNWYAYGARFYDAAIGRFPGVDPIAEKFAWVSVYNYAENEPVGSIDLHGLQRLKASDIGNEIIGDDQKGIITTATPEMRDNSPFLAVLQDASYFALSSLGLNMVDNVVTDIFDSNKSTDQKTNSIASEVYNSISIVPGKAGTTSKGRGEVYVLKEPEILGGAVRRTGRTKDLDRRKNEHAKDPNTKDLNYEEVFRTDNYAEQRGLEHMLYEEHSNTANKANGGLNVNKPIRDDNPKKKDYIKAAEEFLKKKNNE